MSKPPSRRLFSSAAIAFAAILRRIVARPERPALLGEGRIDGAEDAVRLAVGRIELQRGFRRLERLARAVLTRVERGKLGAQLRGLRLELDRLLVRRDRVVDLVGVFEVPPEHEVIGGRRVGRRGRRRLGGGAGGGERDEKTDHENWPHLLTIMTGKCEMLNEECSMLNRYADYCRVQNSISR